MGVESLDWFASGSSVATRGLQVTSECLEASTGNPMGMPRP